jgi:squalene synthase HpnC
MVTMASVVLHQLGTYGPERCPRVTPQEAVAYTRQLVRTHYENFSVISLLLPRDLRDDFGNVYAFCRWADDLGDETGSRDRSLELLRWWREELDRCVAGEPRHPVYVALEATMRRHDLPRKPFDDLIDAFVQDQTVTRYRTWAEVLDYCTRSADPVGRLVLYMAGYRDEQRQRLSDSTCTALQLANFWQDVRRDVLERDRVYLPDEVALKHGLDVPTMVKAIRHDAAKQPVCRHGCRNAERPGVGVLALQGPYRATVRELVERTWPLFERGRSLWPLLNRRIRPQVQLFTHGGESILRMIQRRGFDTMTCRPRLGTAAKLLLMTRVLAGTLWPR